MNIVVRYHGMLRTRMGLKEKTYALQPGMMLRDFIDWATEGRLDLWTNQQPVHQSGAKQPVLIAVDGRLVKDNVVLPGPRHEIDILTPNIGG